MDPAFFELVSTAHSPITDGGLHVWGWEIPVYLFLGGFTAGLMVLAGWALSRGGRNPRRRRGLLPLFLDRLQLQLRLLKHFDIAINKRNKLQVLPRLCSRY